MVIRSAQPADAGLRNATAELGLRPMGDADRSYVMSTWLHSFWPSSHARCSQVEFLRHHDARIKRALADGMRVTIAFDPEFPVVICGWLAHTGATLHYAYVRKDLRGNGVGRALLAAAPGLAWHSHATPGLARMRASGVLNTIYRPGHFPTAGSTS